MHVHCLGLNHNTASLALRERLAFSEEGVKATLARLGCGSESFPPAFSEMVILSTCNRVELYAVAPEPDFTALEAFLAEVQQTPQADFSGHMYRYLDGEAVEHLLRVASGLDSLVLGEPQILGQVMRAFEWAQSQGAAGPILARLFRAALHTGKRARAETAISHNPSSIASVAIRLVSKFVDNLPAVQVTVLGAGEMADLAVEALHKRGVEHITVVNRTLERAQLLAERWRGRAATFESLSQALVTTDILICSTGAPHTLLDRAQLEPLLPARAGRPLVIMDIAAPRDVDPEVGSLPGVQLYDIDVLHLQLETALHQRECETPQVEAIVAQEQAEFMTFMERLDVTPLIAEMRQRAEQIRATELEKTLRRLPGLTPKDQRRLEALTLALVKKLLHEPITRLQAEAGGPRMAEVSEAARELFGLENGAGPVEHNSAVGQHGARLP